MSLRLSSISSLFAAAALLCTAACNLSTNLGGSTGTGGDTGAGGSGGANGSGTTSTASSGTGVNSGVGGNEACAGYLDFAIGAGEKRHFASICAGSWGASQTDTAVGYHFAGGVAPGLDELRINGCTDTSATASNLALDTRKASAPGTYTDGGMSYTDASGLIWQMVPGTYQTVITRFDAVGGVIEGTFALAMSTNDNTVPQQLTGAFHVCRVPDEDVP